MSNSRNESSESSSGEGEDDVEDEVMIPARHQLPEKLEGVFKAILPNMAGCIAFLRGINTFDYDCKPISSDSVRLFSNRITIGKCLRTFDTQETESVMIYDPEDYLPCGFMTFSDIIGVLLLWNSRERFRHRREFLQLPLIYVREILLREKERLIGHTSHPTPVKESLNNDIPNGNRTVIIEPDIEGKERRLTERRERDPKGLLGLPQDATRTRNRSKSDTYLTKRPNFRPPRLENPDQQSSDISPRKRKRRKKKSIRSHEEEQGEEEEHEEEPMYDNTGDNSDDEGHYDDTGTFVNSPRKFYRVDSKDRFFKYPLLIRGLKRDIWGVPPSASLWNAMNLMFYHRIHRIPVFSPKDSSVKLIIRHFDVIRAMVHYFDFRNKLLTSPITKLGIVSKPGDGSCIRTFTYDDNLSEILLTMMRSGMTIAPIVDSEGKLIDCIAKPDVANIMRMMLENHDNLNRDRVKSEEHDLLRDEDGKLDFDALDKRKKEEEQREKEEKEERSKNQLGVPGGKKGGRRRRKMSHRLEESIIGIKFRLENATCEDLIKQRKYLLREVKAEDDVDRRKGKKIIMFHIRTENTSCVYDKEYVEANAKIGGYSVRTDLLIVKENEKLGYVLRHLVGKRFKYLFVNDKHGKFVGIIKIRNIFEFIQRFFREDFVLKHPDFEDFSIIRKDDEEHEGESDDDDDDDDEDDYDE